MRTALLLLVFLASMPMVAEAKHDRLRQSVRQYVKSAEAKALKARTLPQFGGTYIREREFHWR